MMEQLDKKAHPDMIKHTTLDSDTLQSAFNRLHDRAMASKEENMKKLREKYLHEGKHKAISADEVKNSANRLCNESISHMQENHKKLFEKYVEATSTKFPKLSKEQLKASADRLSKKDKYKGSERERERAHYFLRRSTYSPSSFPSNTKGWMSFFESTQRPRSRCKLKKVSECAACQAMQMRKKLCTRAVSRVQENVWGESIPFFPPLLLVSFFFLPHLPGGILLVLVA
jgi:hypothetical protein